MKKTFFGFIYFTILLTLQSNAQVVLFSAGGGNWGTASIWRSKFTLTGNITTSTGSTTVTGSGTSFLTELTVGTLLYQANGTTLIGTVSSITNNTSLVLSGNAAVSQTNLGYKISRVPISADNVITNDNSTVLVNVNATCASLEITSGPNSADLRINAGMTLTVTGNVTINPGANSGNNRELAVQTGTLNCASFIITDPGNNNRWSRLSVGTGTINITGDITMNAPAGNTRNTLTFTSTGTVNIGGDFWSGGEIVPASTTAGLVNYNGTSGDQVVKADTYADITFSGGATKTLAGAVIVTDVTTFTNGIVNTTAANLLTINTAGTVTGASNASYVNGPVAKIGSAAFTFPVGKVGAGYHLCGISAAAASQSFTAEYMRASGADLGAITSSGLYYISPCEYWKIDRTSGASNVDVTLSWNGFSNCNSATYVTDLATLTIAHFNGTNWDTHGNNSTTGNVSSGTITRNAVSVFSPFALGSTSSSQNRFLPVKFDRLNAINIGEDVQLNWTIFNESDVDHYEIERSTDSRQFTSIGQKIPSFNNSGKAVYYWLDTSVNSGTYYYRIKAVYGDNSFNYTTVIKISLTTEENAFTIYPNPVMVHNTISLKANNLTKGNYMLRVYNIVGELICKQNVIHPGGAINQELSFSKNNTPGMYVLQLENNGKFVNKTFIVN